MPLSGQEIKSGFKKGKFWNVAEVLGANEGIIPKASSIKKDMTIEIDDSLGNLVSKDGVPGFIKVEGDYPAYLRYDGLDIPIALFMGTAGAPTQQGATAAYAYTYKFKTNLDGIYGTMARNMKYYLEEYPSVKVTKLHIKGEVGKPLDVAFGMIVSDKRIVNNTSAIAATVTVGDAPYAALYCPSNKMVYVSNTTTGSVSVVDPTTNTIVATVSGITTPAGMCYCPTNDRIYVGSTTDGGGVVKVVNPASNTVVATINIANSPVAIAYCPSNDRLYVVKKASTYGVAVVNPSDNSIVTTIAQAATPASTDIVYCASQDKLYTANDTDGTVTVINPDDNTVVTTITTAAGTRGIEYCPTSDRVYACNFTANSVSVINPATDTVAATIASVTGAGSIKYCESVNRLYVGVWDDVVCRRINPATNTLESATITVGDDNRYMCYCEHNNRIYLPTNAADAVKVIIPESNTLTTFADVTNFEESHRIRFSEGTVRMNVQSAGALGDVDKIYPSMIELVASRKIKGEYDGQYRTYYPNPQDLSDEPANDGMPEITLKMTFPRHNSATNLIAVQNDTRYKLDITFVGASIAGSYLRTFKIQFPHLQLKPVDVGDNPQNIPENLEFVVHGASTAPSGMTGITDPFWISGINRRTTDPLA